MLVLLWVNDILIRFSNLFVQNLIIIDGGDSFIAFQFQFSLLFWFHPWVWFKWKLEYVFTWWSIDSVDNICRIRWFPSRGHRPWMHCLQIWRSRGWRRRPSRQTIVMAVRLHQCFVPSGGAEVELHLVVLPAGLETMLSNWIGVPSCMFIISSISILCCKVMLRPCSLWNGAVGCTEDVERTALLLHCHFIYPWICIFCNFNWLCAMM